MERESKLTEQSAIEVRGLRKSFGEQQVLNGIDLTAARGEVLAVLGKSGTGKSVLLRHLVGLEKPDTRLHLYQRAGNHKPPHGSDQRGAEEDRIPVSAGSALRFFDN